ncbi:MAG: 16S rRNA (cytosine(967)-C(5))-methyltransferase RsmB [Actinomycetes bacterium]
MSNAAPNAAPNARSIAVDLLERIEAGAYAHVLVPIRLRSSGLEARDRAFVTFLVYGTVREQRRLDALLAPRCHQPVDRLEAPVRAALRLGAFQLVHGLAAHAAVGETVSAAPARARGLVNAVLRKVADAGPPFPDPVSRGVRWSYPDWIVDELAAALPPERVDAVLATGNEPAAVTLRANRSSVTSAALADELEAAGVTVEHGQLMPEALIVRGLGDPATLAAVAEGRATPQDQGSQAVVDVLDPQPGDRVLDVAAAPGGKATAIAERIGTGSVVAADVHAGRLDLVTTAATRLGLTNVQAVVADGRRLPVRDGAFDRVLVDAPCSGLGVLRRRPEARWRITRRDVDDLVPLQRALLGAAARAVAPGGRLVYAVCTLTHAETSGIAGWALANLDGFVPVPPPGDPWEARGPGALLWPDRAGTDGMFVLVLRRSP